MQLRHREHVLDRADCARVSSNNMSETIQDREYIPDALKHLHPGVGIDDLPAVSCV